MTAIKKCGDDNEEEDINIDDDGDNDCGNDEDEDDNDDDDVNDITWCDRAVGDDYDGEIK